MKSVTLVHSKIDEISVPVECYIMQGKYPLPPKVIQKFSKTGGELCSNMFLMGEQI